jgi:hypothetical protein
MTREELVGSISVRLLEAIPGVLVQWSIGTIDYKLHLSIVHNGTRYVLLRGWVVQNIAMMNKVVLEDMAIDTIKEFTELFTGQSW